MVAITLLPMKFMSMARAFPSHNATSFAVGHINASAAVPITEAELLAATASDPTPVQWRHHVEAFLDETDVETLSDIARSGALTYAQLARAASRHLSPEHPTRQWLDERA